VSALYGDLAEMALRLVVALGVGALIGLERSYQGRPAGFRTHALVSLSTCLLMLVTAYEHHWIPQRADVNTTLDPTRMAQGIMTGIGFLGAGAILKTGVTVRGLTTAASIWTTAALGILIGIGFYAPAAIAAALTLGTLSVFRWIESRLPTQSYARFIVRLDRSTKLREEDIRRVVSEHGFAIANCNYRLDDAKGFIEYRMVIRTARAGGARELAKTLQGLATVKEFRLSPTGD
jgi:putative Mg2+ transporter-C (MgtC) family protein